MPDLSVVGFCDDRTALMDKGRTTTVIYLDFCKSFDMVPHNILFANLERHGFDDVVGLLSGAHQATLITTSPHQDWGRNHKERLMG